MVPLSLENFKSNLPHFISNALKKILGFNSIKIRPELEEIKNLVEHLQDLPNVNGVRVVRHKTETSRRIIFQILSNVTPSTRIELVKEATDLAAETEWNLDAITNSRDWNCEIRVVKKFEESNQNQIIIFNNARAKSEYLPITS